MAPLPYSGDIELLTDMLEDLEALRLELNQEETEPREDEQQDWGPKNQRSEDAA